MMLSDMLWLTIALVLYGAGAVAAIALAATGSASYRLSLSFIGGALGAHSVAIILRWVRLDHGPYVNMFEILSSNVWSLHLAVFIACLTMRRIRPMLATVLPALMVLVIWLATTPATDVDAPVTYATPLLAVHVWLGKIFLGCVVIAVGLCLIVLLRQSPWPVAFLSMPDDDIIEAMAYRFVLVAFVFQSLMLVAGAVWASDAWGRYWAWDPLETWAFATWLAVAAYIHVRAVRAPNPYASALMIIGIFVLAFSTFFGMPFVSTAPHKGAI